VDGNTYPSECAAFAESTSVDYPGPCASSGFIGHNGRPYCAAKGTVDCPKLPQQGCLGITPPGACCPKCAGALQILLRYVISVNIIIIRLIYKIVQCRGC